MPIAVNCGCGKQFRVPDEYAGKKIKCTSCGEMRIVAAGAKNGAPKTSVPAGKAGPAVKTPAVKAAPATKTAPAVKPAPAAAAAIIKFECAECEHQMTARAEYAGKKTKCPACQAIVTIPKPEEEDEVAEEVAEETPKARIQAGKPQPKKAAKAAVEEEEAEEVEDEEIEEAEVDEDEEEQPKGRIQSGKSVKKAAGKRPAADEDEEIEEAEVDDEEIEEAEADDDEEDEEEERPKKGKKGKKAGKKSGMGLWIGIGAGGLLLIVVGVLALVFMRGGGETTKAAQGGPGPGKQVPVQGRRERAIPWI